STRDQSLVIRASFIRYEKHPHSSSRLFVSPRQSRQTHCSFSDLVFFSTTLLTFLSLSLSLSLCAKVSVFLICNCEGGLIMADWGPVIVAVLLFVLLSPGLLFQMPAKGRVVEFGNMQTSGASILVHAIIYFGLITIFVIAIGVHIYTGN
ncbi:hypothetical protein F2P56_019972, partial [Juglans regia]